MADNLGDLLRKHETTVIERQAYAEQEKLRQQAEIIQQGIEQAQGFLDSLRQTIPEDAKKEGNWSAVKRGMTYVIPESRLQVLRTTKHEYYLQEEKLWDDFVLWAKERGLNCTLNNQSHYETNGADLMWSEHDYYYILLRPL